MNLILLSLLGIGLYLIIIYVIEDSKKKAEEALRPTRQPEPPKETISLLDYQFDGENFPSQTYAQMFYSSTPWLHGRGLGDGKIFITRDANIQQPQIELSQDELNQLTGRLFPSIFPTTTSPPVTPVPASSTPSTPAPAFTSSTTTTPAPALSNTTTPAPALSSTSAPISALI